MSRALLDTDILSEVLKKRDARVVARGADYLARHGEFTIASISAMEIVYGLHRANRAVQLADFEATLGRECNILPFDAASAVLAGRIDADLERSGTSVNVADVMIAAVALVNGLPVVTGNVAHFGSIASAGYPLTTS